MVIGLVLGAALAGAQIVIGDWIYSETRDPMTDQVYARVFAHGRGGAIAVKCDAPGADSLYFQFIGERYLGGSGPRGGRRDFEYRFDSGEPNLAQLSYAGDSGLSDNADVGPFARQAAGASVLRVRAYDVEGREVMAAIPVRGAAAAIERVRRTCGAVIPAAD